ncbi:MAG: 3-keto-5-aminohexanoate cleavage protein, partial [Kordiimonadaceae bacterium]|nr:3-keto-5-aminohexanoate cleavage protein [Kordiimonadaceae bacterium]
KYFQELGVKPEIEVFAPGDVLLANQMLKEGLFDTPPMYQIVMGTNWGLPATTETLTYMRSLLPQGAVWAAFGIARMQMPMVAQAVLLGGNVRVGLEDNLYLSRGVFATNGQLVERARTIIECMGYEVATPDEARQIMGLKPQ